MCDVSLNLLKLQSEKELSSKISNPSPNGTEEKLIGARTQDPGKMMKNKRTLTKQFLSHKAGCLKAKETESQNLNFPRRRRFLFLY